MISTDKIPRSTNIMEESFIKPEEAKHERKNSNPHRSMSSMLRSNIVEKKEIIRKEDKAIKACLMLEEHLRQFNETEFSKFSMRTLQASQQLLNDVKTAIELPSLNLRQGQEHIKVLETLEFLEKMTVLGTQFLKHNRNSNRGVIHEKAEKSGKRSNIFSARMANSLMSLDKLQRSKADSFKSRDSKVVDSSQEKSKKTPPTLKMNENKQKSDESRSLMRPSLDEISQIQNTGLNQEDNINKFNFQITEKQNEEKNQTFENLKIIPPRSLIKQSQGLGHEDGIISFKKFREVATQHSFGFLAKGRKTVTVISPIRRYSPQSRQKKKKITSILHRESEAQKLRRQVSFQVAKKKIEESLIKYSLRSVVKEENVGKGQKGTEYSEKVKDVWDKLNNLLGATTLEKRIVYYIYKENLIIFYF